MRFYRTKLAAMIVGLGCLATLLSACTSTQIAAMPYVDLRARTPLPQAAPVEIVHLRMGHQDVAGQRVLEGLGIDRFVAAELENRGVSVASDLAGTPRNQPQTLKYSI